MPFPKSTSLIYAFIGCIIIFSSNIAQSETINSEVPDAKRIVTLWADKETCLKTPDNSSEKTPMLISVESGDNAYKVAACASAGCRISVPEFGKRAYSGDFRHDSKFTWLSDTVFEAEIFGQKRRFYHCLTKVIRSR